MGETIGTFLTVKGWPARAVVHEELRRNDKVIKSEVVGLDADPLVELAARLDGMSPPCGFEEQAGALREVAAALGGAGFLPEEPDDWRQHFTFKPGGHRCPACHHERDDAAFFEVVEGVARCPECGYEDAAALFEVGELVIASEQRHGAASLEPLRDALRAAEFAYDCEDEGGMLTYSFSWKPGLEQDERAYPFAEGRVLTEDRWQAILNGSRSLAEAANKVSDLFGWGPITDRGVAEALADNVREGVNV